MTTTPETTPLSSPLVKEFHEQFPTPYLDQTPRPARCRSYSASVAPTHDLLVQADRYGHLSHPIHGPHSDKVREDIIKMFGDTSPLKSM
jgi:hypothetical protein